jgi:hypothetical protein
MRIYNFKLFTENYSEDEIMYKISDVEFAEASAAVSVPFDEKISTDVISIIQECVASCGSELVLRILSSSDDGDIIAFTVPNCYIIIYMFVDDDYWLYMDFEYSNELVAPANGFNYQYHDYCVRIDLSAGESESFDNIRKCFNSIPMLGKLIKEYGT